jgi:hypothetical protein
MQLVEDDQYLVEGLEVDKTDFYFNWLISISSLVILIASVSNIFNKKKQKKLQR